MDNDKLLTQAEKLVKKNKLDDAQAVLNGIAERGGRWHFIQSELYFKKNWTNESRKQLEIAMEKEPENETYKQVYEKFTQTEGEEVFKNPYSRRQMGSTDEKSTCFETCCECGGECACAMLCEAICNGF